MADWVLRNFSEAPRGVLWLSLGTLTIAAWLFLAAAPEDVLAAICGPSARPPGAAPAILMWLAMALAMMLPVAAPMLSAYLDIAEAARAKSIAVVPAPVLAGGYAVVWIAFSLAAGTAQAFGGGLASNPSIAGAILIGAGLYQFAPLKHACLAKCRRPMPFFMSRWSDRPFDVFRMGVEQGFSCLGCCWALMIVSFAAGAMNLAWMALLGVLMILERMLAEPRSLVAGAGIGLVVAGAILILGGGT
jgi:predicted metal-binding membrane protein